MIAVREPTFKSGANRGVAKAPSGTDENQPNLKMFEREDWTLFRTVEGLQQKAGVPATRLRRLVLKELGDNAHDAGAAINAGRIKNDQFFIEDDGPGFDGTPEQIAELFSIKRPMRSSKLLRLPQRGALGNGLRVVAGAVLASVEGSLTVVTRNRRIVLRPQMDGLTTVIKVTKADQPIGTRIEIGFGPALPADHDALAWLNAAHAMASDGKRYEGSSSPFWFDAAAFHEVLLACGSQPVRSLIAQLDGCSGGKAGDIVGAAGLDRMACKDINRQQATRLLQTARKQTRPVSPERLGYVGRDAFPDHHYAVERGTVELGSSKPQAEIPFVIETWAEKTDDDDINIDVLINRTPSVDEVSAYRRGDKNLCLHNSGLSHYTEDAPKKGAYDIKVNVTTPYCPITSDGKAPNLEPFVAKIMAAVSSAMRKAQRAAPKDKKITQKDCVLDNLHDAIAAVSGDGEYRFNARQLFYALRPIIKSELDDAELQIGNFTSIITDYEDENGEIEGMYREPRGSITHPHRDETITLVPRRSQLSQARHRPARRTLFFMNQKRIPRTIRLTTEKRNRHGNSCKVPT